MQQLQVKELRVEECIAASRLINAVADAFVIPDFSEQGARHFQAFVTPGALCERLEAQALVLAAWIRDELVGIIELRDGSHIALLFTATAWQGRGVARTLLEAAVAASRVRYGTLEQLSVNASAFAVPVYEKLGFSVSGPEEVANGVRFTPMRKTL